MTETKSPCRFLGFKHDPKTHASLPSARHYCHHFNSPCAISKEIQTTFCMEGETGTCPLAMLKPADSAPAELLRKPKNRSILRKLVKSFA